MEDDGLDDDPRIARQGVAEVAELPSGLAVDQQDPRLIVGDLDRHASPVVVGADVPLHRREGDGQGDRADLLHRDAERDDRARPVGRGGDDLAHRRCAGAVERDGDLAAGVAVELERGLDAGDVPLVDRLGRLDRGDRDVSRRGRRADQDGIDRDAPSRQAIDGRRRVAGPVLPPVGQEDDPEHRRRAVAKGLGQGGRPVGRQGRGVVGLARMRQGLGDGRQRCRGGLAREGDRLDRVIVREPPDRRVLRP